MIYKVLMIEDDPVISEMYCMKFEMEWFIVEKAFDWVAWLEKIKTFNPDIVFLDIMMPTMNWIETVFRIKEEINPNLKVVMFTNLNDSVNRESALMMWADDYLIKADTTPKLAVETVRMIMNMWKKIIKWY